MKFTPNIDKNVKLHDASKKLHISFDDEPEVAPKKRSHPAHENDSDKKKAKVEKKDRKEKKDKQKKKEKKLKEDKKADSKIEKIEPSKTEKKDTSTKDHSKEVTSVKAASGIKATPIAKPSAVSIDVPKVRGSNTTPKKANKNKHAPPPKKTQEEILARVAAIRKKKQLRRNAKTKVDGQVISKPTFQLIPTGLSDKLLPTKDLGNFCLFALSETNNLPWCNLVNKTKIEHLVVAFAQGLNCTDFGISFDEKVPTFIDLDQLKDNEWAGKASMPFLCKTSKYMITHEISGSKGKFNSPVADILQCNISNSKKERLLKEMNERLVKFKDNMRDYYVLSLEEMRKADFPIPPFLDPSVVLPDGWKQTHPSEVETDPSEPKKIIAVDCEMVLTAAGSTLARITLINEDGSVLLDELVKPELPVIDYLTKYSGITPAAMRSATCSLRRAQKHVRKLVNHNVILVGHGLENDLKAMQISHPYCVDTSLLYDHHRGPPYKPSLRFLARNYLKRFIQDRNETHVGHDSAEDARATLDLFKLKLDNKPRFGRFKYTELIMDRLSANRPPRSSVILESSSSDQRSFGSTQNGPYFRVDTDDELVDLTLEKLKDTNFLFSRFQVADSQVPQEKKDNYNQTPQIVPSAAKSSSKRALNLQKLDSYLRKIYLGLPENSFLVVTGGVCDVPAYKKLFDKHRKSQEGSGEWTDEDQALLCKYAANARTSSSFFLFKPMA